MPLVVAVGLTTMFLEGWRWLSSSRFKLIIQTMASELDISAPLIFLKRVPLVNAFQDELIGRVSGDIYAADLIADDQAAVVYQQLKLEMTTNTIPNLKTGQLLTQELLDRLNRMKMAPGGILPADVSAMDRFTNQLAAKMVQSVRERQNALACAMLIDGGANYDRLGISLRNATWGMPANLKVTTANFWSTDGTTPNVNATPISDILVIANEVAADNYGIRYDRVTMGSKAFRFAVATNEFRDKAQTILGFAIGANSPISVHDQPRMQAMMGALLNMDIELYDAAVKEKLPDTTVTRNKYLPVNKVLFTMKQDDGNANVWDMANLPVTESLVANFISNVPDGLGGEQWGPVGYWTGNENLNPPNVTAWGISKSYPRKFVQEASAVLTIGTFAA